VSAHMIECISITSLNDFRLCEGIICMTYNILVTSSSQFTTEGKSVFERVGLLDSINDFRPSIVKVNLLNVTSITITLSIEMIELLFSYHSFHFQIR
jgi:hypothetical protein